MNFADGKDILSFDNPSQQNSDEATSRMMLGLVCGRDKVFFSSAEVQTGSGAQTRIAVILPRGSGDRRLK
jgi:hypothetical protein